MAQSNYSCLLKIRNTDQISNFIIVEHEKYDYLVNARVPGYYPHIPT